jgi:hypothetical protein
MITLWVNDKDFSVHVKHGPGEGFIPNEESIAIGKYAELVKAQLDQFLKEKHEPMVQKLLQMVSAYNVKHNESFAKQVEEQRKKEEEAKAAQEKEEKKKSKWWHRKKK